MKEGTRDEGRGVHAVAAACFSHITLSLKL